MLNPLYFFFLRENFTRTKKHKTHISEQKQKRQHFYAHKKHLRGEKSLVWRFVLLTLFVVFKLFTLFVLFDLIYITTDLYPLQPAYGKLFVRTFFNL